LIYEDIGELEALVIGKVPWRPLANGHANAGMALHWPMAWFYWPNNPLANGV